MTRLKLGLWRLLAVPCVLAQTGVIQFLPREVNATEGCQFFYNSGGQFRCCTYDFIGLSRFAGTDGVITATLVQLPGTNATEGVDFDFGFNQHTVTWQDGESDPKSILFIMYNNDVAEPTKVVHLGIETDPPNATSPFVNQTTATIRDDNDGGTISIAPLVVPLEERFGSGECVMWAERQGPVFSGRTELSVMITECPGSLQPQYRATIGVDFWTRPFPGRAVWEDGESGKKCVATSLGFQSAIDLNNGLWEPENWTVFFLMNPDAAPESEERICLTATLTQNSTATLEKASEQAQIVIVDVDQKSALQLNCTRGLSCLLDVSETSFIGDEPGFLRDADDSNFRCGSFCDEENSSETISFRTEGDADVTFINLQDALSEQKPGDKVLCKCNAFGVPGATFLTATMELHGPYLSNTAGCAKSWATCDIPQLLGVGFKVGFDHIRVLSSCANPQTTQRELADGSHARYGADGYYRMELFELMRPSRTGMYQLCWCRETTQQDCTQLSHFSVKAGVFVYAGPNARAWFPSHALGSADPFIAREVFGTLLTPQDRAMVLPKCGEGSAGFNVSASYDEVDHSFNFGRLSATDGLLAMIYKVCWCQPRADRGHKCDSPSEFRAEIGSVAFLCPPREVDADHDGICELCPLMIQTAGGWEGMECVIDGSRFLLAWLWYMVSTLLFLACTTSLRCCRTGAVVQGVPRLIEDVSRESGGVLVTVVGYHNLTVLKKTQSIPVTLWGTGHFRLDSRTSKRIPFRVRPLGPNTLELLDAEGRALEFRADSSMGDLRLSMFRAMFHSTVGGVRFPLFAQIIVLLAGWGILCTFLSPSPTEIASALVVPFLFAAGITLVWHCALRTSSSLTRRLERFSQELKQRNPHPTASKKGPDRAIAVRDIFELYEKFCAFIKDRNMYYIDPNILRRLTAHDKLSYAELVGPQKVQWFVSHWWGTRFQVYCMALQRHAKAVCETSDEATWGATSYWICTFSNNQYQIKEELGTSHKESSFYLALHSGICRGTCMILDEMAMPLKRSWCLFELLQTIGLEETQVGFKGLLFCTENGVLNFGASTVEMSMQIGERLSTLSLQDAEATTEEDKNMITQLVLQEMESFDKIDTVLREHISEALGICRDRVDADFRTLFKKLGTLGDDSVPVKPVKRTSKRSEAAALKL